MGGAGFCDVEQDASQDGGVTPTKRCDLCDTVLEFEADGQRFAFTAHTPELCRAGTIERIRHLQQALVTQQEVAERAIRRVVRDADRTLADAGLETLTERGKRMGALALAEAWRAGAIEILGVEPYKSSP